MIPTHVQKKHWELKAFFLLFADVTDCPTTWATAASTKWPKTLKLRQILRRWVMEVGWSSFRNIFRWTSWCLHRSTWPDPDVSGSRYVAGPSSLSFVRCVFGVFDWIQVFFTMPSFQNPRWNSCLLEIHRSARFLRVPHVSWAIALRLICRCNWKLLPLQKEQNGDRGVKNPSSRWQLDICPMRVLTS